MKKISLLALISATAFFAACGDDSSSSPSSKELPKSVKTFEELIKDTECSADVKCAQVLVEEYSDTYECDGNGQWNMVMETMPSKVCPAEASSSNSEEEEEPAASSDSKAEEPAASTDSKTDEKPAASKNLVSCTFKVSMTIGAGEDAMSFETNSCSEIAEDDPYATTLNENCINIDESVEGMTTKQVTTKGTGCDTNAKIKCTGSAGNTVYLYDDDADCKGVK